MNEDIKNEADQPGSQGEGELNYAFQKSRIWIKFLSARWLVIVMCCIAGIAAGILYATTRPVQFESYLTFSLDENNNNSGGGLSSLVAQFGIGSNDNSLFSGDNIVEVIKSRTILERVLLSTDTVNGRPVKIIDYFKEVLPGLSKGKKDGGNSKVTFANVTDRSKLSYAQDSMLYKTYMYILKHHLTAARPDKQLNIYFIKFLSPDERFTKIFTDHVLAETIKFYTELKTKKSETTLGVLEQRIGVVKGNLNQSISNKANTQDANINPAFAAAQVPLQKQQLNTQVYGAAYAELYKNLELARFQYLQNIPLLQVINDNHYPMAIIEKNWIKTGLIGGFLFGLLAIFSLTLYHLVRYK